ncbi:sugar nucleotide-binding protein [Altererythrobacter xixiisoli]|uniref:dTDP-4-dehydrorhamnose reductase n=2 Tax=Croceibacterium xixiisoli TaxID=1476466 RepID=A0A6I4TX33_9SPHN|nr:SDR family oxidoreductase [Croceibacterium xixiisoli]MXP00587.1 sugar nucleotide-binding protein [Croceibacterium xixiisoli]
MGSAAGATGPLQLWGGVECTINRLADRYVDQIVLSGHDRRSDDIDRLATLGITALRYPLLWESCAQAPDPQAWWAWHDARLERLCALGIRPILGLVHHGSGPPATNLLSPGFVTGLAEHARQAVQRYPWAEDWTPVNEPLTTARFSALYGHWYPHLQNEQAFWNALLTQVEAIRAAMVQVRQVNAGARLIQTEDLGTTTATPERQVQADFDNQRRWASWDMLVGLLVPGHPLWDRLAGMGFSDRLQALARQRCAPDILGINHYLTSDRHLDHRLDMYPPHTHGDSGAGPIADVAAVQISHESAGMEGALRACWDRYRIPMALTEVHNGCTREEQLRWLVEAWSMAGRLQAEGIGIHALTAWSLLGSHDWDSLLTRSDGHYESGVFDVRSHPPRETALAPALRHLANGGLPDHPTLRHAGWWKGHALIGHTDVGAAAGGMVAATRPLLIAGFTGTLGQAFAGACRLRGIDHVITRRDQLDITDPASIGRILDELNPWAVVNAAGWVRVDDAERDPAACMAANHAGALALADGCALRGIHYTAFSSDLVFDGLLERPYVESNATAPLSIYGRSKAAMDAALSSCGQRALVIRTASFFSPFDQHNFAVHLISALRSGERFRAAADCWTSPTYVPDLVRTTLDLIIDDEAGLWHVVNDGAVTWTDFAMQIADAAGHDGRLVLPTPMRDMGWSAPRPRYAAMTSERGVLMPKLTGAIERFAADLG